MGAVLGTLTCDQLRTLSSGWSDGGLWDNIRWLAQRFWDTPQSSQDERVAWHHLVMAIGNFKRQSGRRLHPAQLHALEEVAASRSSFVVPGTAVLVARDTSDTWMRLCLPGMATATRTTLLAALWPDHHHVLDWRVLCATVGVALTTLDDTRLRDSDSTETLTLMDEHYERIRALLLAVRDRCNDLDLLSIERALYRLDQRRQKLDGTKRVVGRSWGDYKKALLAAAP